MSLSTAKRVLLISWHFPPYKSSSAFNLFKRIKDTGFHYDVLHVKQKELPENEGMFRFSSSTFHRYEIAVPREDGRDRESRELYCEKVSEFFNQLRRTTHYSVMLSHSHELVSHIAALSIKTRHPELRWVASFGDPIAGNPFNESYNFPFLEEDSKTESEVLVRADRIVVTNRYQRDVMVQTARSAVSDTKFFILPHCFDERMYPSSQAKSYKKDSAVFKFRHIGMLYKHKRTSEPFLLAAQKLVQKYPHLRGKFCIEFFGATDRYIQSAASYGLADSIRFQGNVSYLESLSRMSESDCLLLRDADFSDQGVKLTPFYPGKLADYLGAKKPVIAVTMKNGCVPDMLQALGGVSVTESDVDELAELMAKAIEGKLTANLKNIEEYSVFNVAPLARAALMFTEDKKKVLIAGHDLKFAKFIIDEIRSREDLLLLIDQWKGHDTHDELKSEAMLNQADMIFCEWGLGNAVWYSKRKKLGQKLVVRMHLQEFTTRHPEKFTHSAIDAYVMVSPFWHEKFVHAFSLDRTKAKMVFNLVDVNSLDRPKDVGSLFNLGLLGYVPQRKRLDKALDLFERLFQLDNRYKLFIKGAPPESFPWMMSKSRAREMEWYTSCRERINTAEWGRNVFFEEHGPIEAWFQKIGYIISVSDFESFHLSPAEGMASGATPLILPWPGSETIYPPSQILSSVSEMVISIVTQEFPDTSRLKLFATTRFASKVNARQLLELYVECNE